MAAPVAKPRSSSRCGDRDVRGVERVAQLHGAVLAGQARGEDRGHRRLRPRGVRDRRVEDDRVLREGVELGGRLARVAVDAGVVGAQRVHEVDDRERAPCGATVIAGAPQKALLRVARLLVAARLEHQLAPRAGVASRGPRPPGPSRGARACAIGSRSSETRRRPRARPRLHLHHELDARAARGSAGRSRRRAGAAPPFGMSSAKRSRPGGPAGKPRSEDVVQAQAAPRPASRTASRLERRRPRPRRARRRRRAGPRARAARPQPESSRARAAAPPREESVSSREQAHASTPPAHAAKRADRGRATSRRAMVAGVSGSFRRAPAGR